MPEALEDNEEELRQYLNLESEPPVNEASLARCSLKWQNKDHTTKEWHSLNVPITTKQFKHANMAVRGMYFTSTPLIAVALGELDGDS